MCFIDSADEPLKLYQQHVVTARTSHQCNECRRTIEPGEQYERATGLEPDGAWMTCKTCVQCQAVRNWLTKVCGGFLHYGVQEDLEGHLEEGYNPRWLHIAVSGMQRHWRRDDGTLWRPMTLPKVLPVD
jgi:hypothetical protein